MIRIYRFVLLGLLLTLPLLAQSLDDKLLDATRAEDIKAVKSLLKQGADVNAKYRYDATPLFFASDRGNAALVQLLIDKGAEVNAKDTFYNVTPLQWATFNSHNNVVKILLKSGAEGGDAVLASAARNGNLDLAKIALEGMNPDSASLSNALVAAKGGEHDEIVKLLMDAGAVEPVVTGADIAPELLKPYTGKYRNSDIGMQLTFKIKEGRLIGETAGQPSLTYVPVEDDVFKAVEFDGIRIAFEKKDDAVPSFVLTQGERSFTFNRMSAEEEEKADPGAEPIADAAEYTTGAKTVAKAMNWPGFRGPQASGVADGQFPPVKWDSESGKNIKWKVEIPGFAHASPVIWEDRIFITTSVSSDTSAELRVGLYGDVAPDKDVSQHSWEVLAIDRKSGKILWRQVAHKGVPKVKRHTKASQNNSTPVTDGKYVVALFGAEGLYCYDVDGNLQWKKDLGFLDSGWFFDPDYQWGHGSSPIIYKDMVIVQCDIQKDSYIAAYRLKDGREVWKKMRDEIPSWSTPTVYEAKSGPELITNATNRILAYDPDNGNELWYIKGNSEIAVPTPLIAHDMIYVTSGYRPIQPIYAVKPGGRDDITPKDTTANEHVVWSTRRGGPYMPTPIIYGDYLYVCANNGTVSCYDALTGERKYRERLGGRGGGYAFSGSPVAADGKIYFPSEDGEVYVVAAGPEFKLLAKNDLGEVIMTTPAISDKTIYIRTQSHLVAIAAENKEL